VKRAEVMLVFVEAIFTTNRLEAGGDQGPLGLVRPVDE
jgi:hypothetical protein